MGGTCHSPVWDSGATFLPRDMWLKMLGFELGLP